MSLALLVTALAFAVTPPTTPAAPATSLNSGEHAEIARIQTHFDGALEMLAARDLSHLSTAQRERRAELAAELRRYRDRGAFPRNYDFPGEAVPYFIDRKTAVRCAVAHLMEYTGAHELVARVSVADNNVWVAELAGDADVVAWLDANGLTLAEAARIQVPYEGDEPPPLREGGARAGPSAAFTSMAMGTALASTALNTFVFSAAPSRTGVVLGTLSGAFALGAGASAIHDRGAPEMGAASMVAGAVGLYVAGRAFNRLRHQQAAAAQTPAAGSESLQARTTIAPIIPLAGTQGFGASLSLRF